ETVLKELSGEDFQSEISSFVVGDMEELLSYRRLNDARTRWSIWARRISWAIWVWLILGGVLAGLTLFFSRVLNHALSMPVAISSLVIGALAPTFCVIAAGAMLYHHDQISKYRDKIL